jgi:hypothetical protein
MQRKRCATYKTHNSDTGSRARTHTHISQYARCVPQYACRRDQSAGTRVLSSALCSPLFSVASPLLAAPRTRPLRVRRNARSWWSSPHSALRARGSRPRLGQLGDNALSVCSVSTAGAGLDQGGLHCLLARRPPRPTACEQKHLKTTRVNAKGCEGHAAMHRWACGLQRAAAAIAHRWH